MKSDIKPFLLKVPRFFSILIVSLYLTHLVNLYTLNTILKRFFVFMYFFVICSIIVWLKRRSCKKNKSIKIKIISCIITGMILVIFQNIFLPRIQNNTVTFSAENTGEIWIVSIEIDEKVVPISNIRIEENLGWQYNEEYDDYVFYSNGENDKNYLKMNFTASKVVLYFAANPWSGGLQVESNEGDTTILNLYKENCETNECLVLENRLEYNLIQKLIYNVGAFLLVFFGINLCAQLIVSRFEQNKMLMEYGIVFILIGILFLGRWTYGISSLNKMLGISPTDFTMRYRESKYLLNGINPFDIMSGTVPVESNIGNLWERGGTVPWAIAIGIFINFAFFEEKIATFFTLQLFFLSALIFAFFCYNFCRQKFKMNVEQSLLTLLFIFSLPAWGTAVNWLNYGVLCGAALSISCLIEKDYPLLAGGLMAFASIKPQLAIPFYIAFFLKKRWKSLVIASSIPLVFWGISLLLSKTMPFTMLKQMLEIGNTYGVSGFFSYFPTIFRAQMSNASIQFLNILLLFTVLLLGNLLFKNTASYFQYYAVVACFSGMWMYTQEHDRSVQAIVIICLLYLAFQKREKVKICFIICFLLCFYPESLNQLHKVLFGQDTNSYVVYSFIRACALCMAAWLISYNRNLLNEEGE